MTNILFLDTETAPSLGYFYGRYDQNISPDQVVHNGFFLCYQAAINDGEIFVDSIVDKVTTKRDLLPEDDRELVIRMAKLVEENDIIVAHNAVKFDLARLYARMAAHGLKPIRRPLVVDTLRVCRSIFRFEANSLDSVCQELGLGRKFKSGGFANTISCMRGDKEAWDHLLTYGVHDVKLLRDLYYRVRPWMTNHPNVGAISGNHSRVCPVCGSASLRYKGLNKTRQWHTFRCKACGHNCRGSSKADFTAKPPIRS